jgi:hypothetical protein
MTSYDHLRIRNVRRARIVSPKAGVGLQLTTTDYCLIIMSIFDRISLPPLLLELPRNPAIAVGIPIVLGTLSGYPTGKVVKGPWYEVRFQLE